MPFDEQGYIQAAKVAGIPMSKIKETVASKRTGVGGWLQGDALTTGGKLWQGAGNILNLPSYAIGGALNQAQRGVGSEYGQDTDATGLGMIEGIKNKRAVMSELPETFGVDPNSKLGMGIGFAGELLVPNVPVGKALKLGRNAFRGADAVSDVSKAGNVFSRGLGKAGQNIIDEGSSAPLRGFGRNNTTQRMLSQIGKTGQSTDEFFDTHKLWGRDLDEAQKALSRVSDEYTQAAFKSGQEMPVAKIVQDFDKEIARLTPMARESTAAGAELKRLQMARDSFVGKLVNEANQSSPLNVNIGEVARSKQIVGKDVPKSYFNLGSAQTGAGEGAEGARRIFKSNLDQVTGGKTAKLGASESALIEYKDLLKKADTAKSGNKQFSFQKTIAPGFGGMMAGAPGLVAGVAMNTLANSPTGIKTYSKAARGIGKAIKSPKTSKALKSVGSKTYKVGKTAFRIPSARKEKVESPQVINKSSRNSTPSFSKNLSKRKKNIFD